MLEAATSDPKGNRKESNVLCKKWRAARSVPRYLTAHTIVLPRLWVSSFHLSSNDASSCIHSYSLRKDRSADFIFKFLPCADSYIILQNSGVLGEAEQHDHLERTGRDLAFEAIAAYSHHQHSLKYALDRYAYVQIPAL